MDSPREHWAQWASFLRRWRLQGLSTWLLEAAAPLNIIGAQMIHIGAPLVRHPSMQALAHLLEDQDEALAFVDYLNQDTHT